MSHRKTSHPTQGKCNFVLLASNKYSTHKYLHIIIGCIILYTITWYEARRSDGDPHCPEEHILGPVSQFTTGH